MYLCAFIENCKASWGFKYTVFSHTVMFLSFRTDRSGQTVQTQIRLPLRVYTICTSLCIFWKHYSKEKPSCVTFTVITEIFRRPKFEDCYGRSSGLQ